MSDLVIRNVRTHAVMAPLSRPITTAFTSFEHAPLLLIDLETDQGIVGRSYLFGYTPVALAPLVALIDNLSDQLIGRPVAPRARLDDLEQIFRLLGRQGLVTMALAGLDMALWDALGQSQNLSVARLLGGNDDPIQAYDSHGVFVPGRDDALVAHSLAMGFKALKFKLGVNDLALDIATLRALRDLIGPDILLMVDYNQTLTPSEAIRRISHFAPFDLHWVEEPVRAEDFEGHRQVRANTSVPLQTGENWWMPEDAARAVQAGICDRAMLDIMKIGGVQNWLRAAPMAEAVSVDVSSHLFIEASAHLLAATKNRHLLEYLDVASAVLTDPYPVQDGSVAPKGPGLGMTWDMKAVNKYRIG